jgi:hypothetical protein
VDNLAYAPGQGIPNPVTLFRDDKGVFGIGISDDYLRSQGVRCRNIRLVLRPDRINETEIEETGRYPILQGLPPWLPPWHPKNRVNGTQEGLLRNAMATVMRQRAGIEDKKTPRDANLRRRYFGLAITATRMFNGMMAQVVATADPEALRAARRFGWKARWPIYKAAVRSHRVLQLAEVFPLLAYRILCIPNEEYDQAIGMIERGVMLRDIARLYGLPMRLRQIKPGAVLYVPEALIEQPELLDHMPQSLPKMRRWINGVDAATRWDVPGYIAWVARNWEELNGFLEIADIGDWANHPVERRFVPTMSVRTVRQLSAQWHEAVSREEHLKLGPFPNPWFPAHTLTSGEQIVPIVNSEELFREGRAMHHCVASYDRYIISGQVYIYSLRTGDQRIATIALGRDESGKAVLSQIRGGCNAAVPAKINSMVHRWLASQKGLPDRNA